MKYFAYARTAQETCLRLMGRKLLVALAMEGKFSTEGLQAVGEDDDLLMAMARELVTEKGIGENADLVWKQIQEQNATFSHAPSAAIEPEREAQPQDTVLHREPMSPILDQLALFGASLNPSSNPKRVARRPASAVFPTVKQPGLF